MFVLPRRRRPHDLVSLRDRLSVPATHLGSSDSYTLQHGISSVLASGKSEPLLPPLSSLFLGFYSSTCLCVSGSRQGAVRVA
uniref:Uncharacterized protein n=1 Tax=Arundo donax TaxID=35708 RepID=A0A0A8YZ51_ARUDO